MGGQRSKAANQDKFLQLVAQNPGLPDKDMAEMAGVTPTTVSRWHQDAEFEQRYDEAQRKAFKSLVGLATATMVRLAQEGSYQAAQYILNYGGYQGAQNINLTNDVTISVGIEDDEDQP